jgi:hypothetical protein
MSTTTSTIVAFHIGKGGSFYNSGHLSFIGDGVKIGDYTNDLFLNYKYTDEIAKKLRFLDEHSEDVFAYSYTSPGAKKAHVYTSREDMLYTFDTEQRADLITEVFGEDPGQLMWFDGNGKAIISDEDVQSGIGVINIDNDYDTTYTTLLSECDEKELICIMQTKEELGYFASDEVYEEANNMLKHIYMNFDYEDGDDE